MMDQTCDRISWLTISTSTAPPSARASRRVSSLGDASRSIASRKARGIENSAVTAPQTATTVGANAAVNTADPVRYIGHRRATARFDIGRNSYHDVSYSISRYG